EPDPGPTACNATPNVYDPADFDRVLENFERTTTLRLSGSQWDNTLVRNCRIHDTGGDGVYLKDVRNVVIQGCEIWNVGSAESDRGVKLSGLGSTQDVVIDGNYVHDIPRSGIFSGQYSDYRNSNHPGLKILNNRIERTGTALNTGHHPIYVQSSDAYIEGNVISGPRAGNGISIRSSGVVRCNSVSGTSSKGKPGIRYYSDHVAGDSNLLVIENNTIVDDNIGIDLYKPVTEPDINSPPPEHVVKNFVIRYNTIDAPNDIRIHSDYDDPVYNVNIHDNTY
ncbi:MAG: right-handed parallel beta-helix repeat-containing protein, partial [Proteobacteria bacterium]|nr:right-handed parallel beta-helix repeat-containing protein [Pseudomonadota bacterium]